MKHPDSMQHRPPLATLLAMVFFLAGQAGAQEVPNRQAALEMYRQAEALKTEGKNREAARLYERLVEVGPRTFGADSSETATMMNNLAALYEDLGQHDDNQDHDLVAPAVPQDIFEQVAFHAGPSIPAVTDTPMRRPTEHRPDGIVSGGRGH